MGPKTEGSLISLILADFNPGWMNDLSLEINMHPQAKITGFAQTGQAAIERAILMAADAVLIEYSLPDMTAVEVAKRLAEDSPGTAVFAFTTSLSANLVQVAKAVGIVEVFYKENMVGREIAEIIAAHIDGLRREWNNLSNNHGILGRGVGPRGQVVKKEYITTALTQTVVLTYNNKGGVGKSTVAINLATAIKCSKLLGGQRVALVDFDCGSANVSTVCHISDADVENRNIALWEHLPNDLSAREVDDLLIPGPHGIMIAAAPLNQAVADKIDHNLADKILQILKRHFGIIIIDGAPNISPPVDEAINHATHILLIANPEGQSIKQLARTVQLLYPHPEYPDRQDFNHILRKMSLVLNHAQANGKWDLRPDDIARVIGRPLIADIPYDESVKQALHGSQKKQVVEMDPDSPFSQAIKTLAQDICGAYPEEIGRGFGKSHNSSPPKRGFFSNLLGRLRA